MSLSWFRSVSRCQRCTRAVKHQEGIFCANFGKPVIGLPTCQRAWCAPCLPGEDFLIYRERDECTELIALNEEDNYLEARPGDHLFCPFECDLCVFHRLLGRTPQSSSHTDQRLLVYIRRANLDAFWSRRPGTIDGLRQLFVQQVKVGESFGFEMFQPLGPFPQGYDSGIKTAIGVLAQSQKPGRHEAKQKYSSVRKVRSLNTNLYNALARAAAENLVWRSEKARFVVMTAPSESEWYNRFMSSFHSRVGDRHKRDAAISIQQMLAIQEILIEEWDEATTSGDLAEQRSIAETAVFFLVGYCCSLRGFELPKIVLTELKSKIVLVGQPGGDPAHVGVPMVGRFKARTNATQKLLVYTTTETASGLLPGIWVDRLVKTLAKCGVTHGWLFQDEKGRQRRLGFFEQEFYAKLFAIRDRDPTLFAPDIDILEDYQLARSLRRGATTRATNAKVSGPDIDWINRWNTGGLEVVTGPMRVIYSDQKQLLETFLRFSLVL